MSYEPEPYVKTMHDAVCSECGKNCQVPFKPDPAKKVYCRDCWAKRRPPRNAGTYQGNKTAHTWSHRE